MRDIFVQSCCGAVECFVFVVGVSTRAGDCERARFALGRVLRLRSWRDAGVPRAKEELQAIPDGGCGAADVVVVKAVGVEEFVVGWLGCRFLCGGEDG